MKRYGNLFTRIVEAENLRLAFAKARRGKSWQNAVKRVERDLAENLTRLRQSLVDKTFSTSPYRLKTIYEPKQRTIYRLPLYPDRIVQHAFFMKIITFNLKGFDSRPRKERSRAFVAHAAPEKPDVILLQEGVSGLAAGTCCSIAQAVKFFAEAGLSYHSTVVNMTGYPGILTYRLGILTRKPGVFLGVEEIHNGDSVEWEGPFPWYRKIMGVRSGGVNFYNTHFGGGSEAGQMRQAGDALSFIKRTGSQLAVFGGDFNFTGGQAHQLIQSRVFYEAGGGQIDKFYVRGFPSATCEVLFNDPAISDHPCMMATLN